VTPPASTMFGPVPVSVAMPPTFAAHATPSISPLPRDDFTAFRGSPPRLAGMSAASPSLPTLTEHVRASPQPGAPPPPWALPGSPPSSPPREKVSSRRRCVRVGLACSVWEGGAACRRSGAWLARCESLAEDSRERSTASAIGIIIWEGSGGERGMGGVRGVDHEAKTGTTQGNSGDAVVL
jgi:hypothetical protein